MNCFIHSLLDTSEYNELLEIARDNHAVTVTGPSDSQKVHLAYALCEHLGAKCIYVAVNELQARKIFEDFSFFCR